MPRFRYAALQLSGRVRRGLLEANASDEAIRTLELRGETPISVTAISDRSVTGVNRATLSAFLGDLASLIDAGVPIRRALDVFETARSTSGAATLAKLIGERLDAGVDLAGATRVGAHADITFAAELMRAGESSGRLGEALRFAADLLQRQGEFSRRMVQAMIYPTFLLLLSIVALVSLAVFAGPTIAPLLDETPNVSPGLQFVLAAGDVIQSHGFVLLGLIVGSSVAGWAYFRSSDGEIRASNMLIRLPGVSRVIRDINCGSFSRTLGALLSGGVPAVSAISLAAQSATNAAWRTRFITCGLALQDGRSVAQAIDRIPQVSIELKRLAPIGEATGALGDMLTRAGEICIEKALRRLDAAAAIVGPVLILAMGAVTGWLMITFLTGLSQLGEGAL